MFVVVEVVILVVIVVVVILGDKILYHNICNAIKQYQYIVM